MSVLTKEMEQKLIQSPQRKENAPSLFNPHKAGLEHADKDKVNQIVYDLSKNSQFYRNEERKVCLHHLFKLPSMVWSLGSQDRRTYSANAV